MNPRIKMYPDLNFVVILNPANGPGSPSASPNADYVREIPKLNACPNVRTVGYIHTSYCKRPMIEVLKDIALYAEWSKYSKNADLGVGGIFFDETPNGIEEGSDTEAYLSAITEYVRTSNGILGLKLVSQHSSRVVLSCVVILIDIQVVHNPGTAVDPNIACTVPDITTIVETTYDAYRTPEYQQWLGRYQYDRHSVCCMMHSVPVEHIRTITHELRQRAAYLFVTDLAVDQYQSFGVGWKDFIQAMAETEAL
jgi:hypothetical protein